jgi:hypothetical protein
MNLASLRCRQDPFPEMKFLLQPILFIFFGRTLFTYLNQVKFKFIGINFLMDIEHLLMQFYCLWIVWLHLSTFEFKIITPELLSNKLLSNEILYKILHYIKLCPNLAEMEIHKIDPWCWAVGETRGGATGPASSLETHRCHSPAEKPAGLRAWKNIGNR